MNKSGDLGGIGIGLKKEQLPDGRMAIAVANEMIPEQIVVIPEHPNYPYLRNAFPSGTFPRGSTAIVSVQILDVDGNDITPEDSVWKLPLDNYINDETKEVLGVLYMDWVESNMPIIDIGTPEIALDPGMMAPPLEG